MINHSDRCFTHLGDLDISFVLFNISSNFFLHLVSVTKAKIKILFVSPFPTDPIKSVQPGKFYWREKKKRKFFRFRSGNERKLFVQFQFGILLELRMTSLKVIEANPYRKAITTMDTTWCVGAVENRKGWKKLWLATH